MVGPLAAGLEDLHRPSRVFRDLPDHLGERPAIDEAGAGTRRENAVRLQYRDRGQVQTSIALERGLDVPRMAREFGRIADHHVESLAAGFQPLEDLVHVAGLERCPLKEVRGGVSPGHLDRGG